MKSETWGLGVKFERGEKTPTPKISALLRKRPVLLRANFVLTKDRKRLLRTFFVVKYTGRGLVVKRPVVLSCNLRGHLQRCQMPDIENSRKTAEKGAEWVTVKQPEKQPN